MKYKRILLKLSGEALAGAQSYGIDPDKLQAFAIEIKSVVDLNIQVAVVLGGGNIFRGFKGNDTGINRVTGDYMGMIATIINSMALQDVLENQGIKTLLLSGLPVEPLCKRMESKKAIAALEKNKVVLMAGGTGNPFFTTDSAAALRAAEVKADAILKGTRVDGVYSADPEKVKNAVKFDELTFEEAYQRSLEIMDMTAFTLCRENRIPVVVFNINEKGNLLKICKGEKVGTLIKE